MGRRRRLAVAASLVVSGALAACGSTGSEGATATEPVGASSTEATTTSIEATVGSSQVAGPPEGDEERITEGPDREATLRLLDEAIAAIGPERSNTYDQGERFEVRVVEPTDADEDVVAGLQVETSIPVEVVAVAMSEQWLSDSAQRLDAALASPAVALGVDLRAGVLSVVVDPERDPALDRDALEAQVLALVEGYLAEGRRAGSVAEGTSATQAVEVAEGSWGWDS
jgi:hypothetical protein